MTITYVIPGTTQINQLSEPTMDGHPDENADDNCVAASIAEALHILTGKTYDGDELKDAVYGQGYVGFQSASRYVAYCAAQGVDLAAHNDTQAGLIATIHSEVSAGHPVLVTMPSQWGTPYSDPVHPSGSTHVGVAVGVGAGYIRIMNPWGGFWQDQPDSWWEPRLCEGQVWPMQKSSGGVTAMSGVPAVSWSDNGSVLTAPNKETCGHGIRAHVLGESWPAELWPVTGEEWDPVGVHQDFRSGGDLNAAGRRLTWHSTDNSISESALESPAAQLTSDLAAAKQAEQQAQASATAAQQQRDALSAQLQQAQAAAQSAQNQLTQAQQQLTADAAQIAQLQQQLAAAQQQPQPAPAPAPAPVPTPTPAPVANPAPTTPAAAAALLVELTYAEALATLKAASSAPTAGQ